MDTASKLYTADEKQQMLDNLDLEVTHRTRQIQSYLSDTLQTFQIRAEGHISRIPKEVRNMSMREFSEKYGADVHAALKGLQSDKLGGPSEIDKLTRKRKWVASIETDAEQGEPRAVKSARSTSPTKKPGPSTGPGTAQRARVEAASANRTPGLSRTMGRIPSTPHPPSPSKSTQRRRVPSTPTFNPTLPKTPGYPAAANSMRLPRRDENMLSLNGSPLANPYELGLGWFAGVESGEDDDDGGGLGDKAMASQTIPADKEQPRLKRSKSIINIRRDPSLGTSLHTTSHSRSTSQSSVNTQSQPTMYQQSHSQPPPQYQSYDTQALRYQPPNEATPRPLPPTPFTHTHTQPLTALVAIPTSDGHLLEFDPLQTSPGALEALDGISDSAKKGAREEMGRLVKMAVERWKIG